MEKNDETAANAQNDLQKWPAAAFLEMLAHMAELADALL